MPTVVALSINSAWNIVNFRAGLVRSLQDAGHRVVAIAPPDDSVARLKALGVDYEPVRMRPRGLSPLHDARLLADYRRILARVRPDVYLGYTIKPNVWGGLAAQSLGIPVINNIAGLGETFRGQGLLNRLVKLLYRTSLARSGVMFFQNPDDRSLFEAAGIISAGKAQLLPGSGVDLSRFSAVGDAGGAAGAFRFLLVARLLKAKGIAEYAAAGRIVRARHPEARLQLLGLRQEGGDAVGDAELAAWQTAGDLEFLGGTDDVRPFLARAHCAVLPTYYPEGTPRSLLEAAATGLPIITTDVPGCREIVRDGVNGLLIPPRDVDALAQAMTRIIAMPRTEREAMGHASRSLAETQFDERIVVRRYLAAIEQLTAR